MAEEKNGGDSNPIVFYYGEFNVNRGNNTITLSNQPEGFSSLVVYKSGNIPEDQWNFKGRFMPKSFSYFMGDYDQNGYCEFYCLTVDSNKLILNVVEPYKSNSWLVRNRLLDTLPSAAFTLPNGDISVKVYDLTGDGNGEILCSINAGNALQPRKIYSYDIKNDSLWSSPLAGSSLQRIQIADIDNDHQIEIFGSNSASYNYTDHKIIYPDDSTRLIIFDRNLHYKYEPVALGGRFSILDPFWMPDKEPKSLIVFVSGGSADGTGSYWSRVVEFTGKSVLMDPIRMMDPRKGKLYFTDDQDYACIWFPDGEVNFIRLSDNSCLKKIKIQVSGDVPVYNRHFGFSDFDYCFQAREIAQTMRFYSKTGKYLGQAVTPGITGQPISCWASQGDGLKQLLIEGHNGRYWFQVKLNPWRYLYFVFLLALIAGFYSFIRLIRYIQWKQIAELEGKKREILELQLKGVRNQLDPHFTFNALNTLSGLSIMNDSKGVEHFISHFSRLLRTHLRTSDKILVSLAEEIEFVVNYVELQRIRFDNTFFFELDIPREVDLGFAVPKMLIQTHVENAIKHGLRPLMQFQESEQKEGNLQDPKPIGLVLVKIWHEGDSLSIIIEDNGVGRGNSQVPVFESTGIGMMSLEKIRESVKQLFGIRIRQTVEDLFNEDKSPAGTRVRIDIDPCLNQVPRTFDH